MSTIRSYIGDRKFYRQLLTVMIPIMLQNAITNFVNMLDNVMVGRIGTLEMTGVSVVNELLLIFNLCIFGAVSGAGIFGAQFYGSRDHDGVRYSFRFKLIIVMVLVTLWLIILGTGKEMLISLFLKGEGTPEDAAAILDFARRYLRIIMIGLVPFGFVQCLSGTLRETDQAVAPMAAGMIAVSVNLFLNYVLIFGHFGAPRLGVEGAAIATVISRYTELVVLLGWTLTHKAKNIFIVGAFRSLYVPAELVKRIAVKGLPLLLNETMWSGGLVVMSQSYSLRSLNVVSACNITNTFFDVFAVAFISAGVAIGILIGQMLGADRTEEAYEEARKMIAFGAVIGVVMGTAFALFSELIPGFYNTTEEVRHLAAVFIRINALMMPVDAFANACYFILRSGGKTYVTLLFDSGFVWAIQVPAAVLLSRFTAMPIVPLYALTHVLQVVKIGVGVRYIRSKKWVQNIVE